MFASIQVESEALLSHGMISNVYNEVLVFASIQVQCYHMVCIQ